MDSIELNDRKKNIVYYILGVVETLIGLRFIFKLLGANASNAFVSFLYSITKIFILPFIGIFKAVSTAGYVFEPATIVAMIMYAILAYGIVKLLKL